MNTILGVLIITVVVFAYQSIRSLCQKRGWISAGYLDAGVIAVCLGLLAAYR